ncbi:unnamed protein product [Adineta ricciae]|uniref:Uncharacterized protein n=1 Tax=Adineta ricciae TaxID=249248 RepID=A0A815VTX2_ADIRI|nr:unnamed protein product [Adineta ricciae]CAF1621718.1 unnamed protein product [Adineta ricciae]
MLGFFIILFLVHVSVATPGRFKRFLNSEVHNRIDVLEQSHSTHRNDTNWMGTIMVSIILSLAIISITIFITFIYICYRVRRRVQATQAPTVAAVEASILPQLHPIIPPLLALLRQQHQLDISPPPHTSLHYPSSTSTATPSIPFTSLPTLKF